MANYPQVILFGSIFGGWREKYVIPLLEELGVTYYNPISPTGEWYLELGDREIDMMAHCETIIMVVNTETPAFTSLAETGWGALGAAQRGQHFILQIDMDYRYRLPDSLRQSAEGQELEKAIQDMITRSRYLVKGHASQFDLETMHLVEDMDGVLAALRKIYA
jgi:hypothetical protein